MNELPSAKDGEPVEGSPRFGVSGGNLITAYDRPEDIAKRKKWAEWELAKLKAKRPREKKSVRRRRWHRIGWLQGGLARMKNGYNGLRFELLVWFYEDWPKTLKAFSEFKDTEGQPIFEQEE